MIVTELDLSIVISSRSNNASSLYFVAYIFSLPTAFVATIGVRRAVCVLEGRRNLNVLYVYGTMQ